MTEADRVFVSIGVSRPGGDLDELPGAIKAAERMAAWAAAQGYATVLVHDRKHGEVTVDLLRHEIAAAITEVTDRTELKRLVVFFAGHGAAMAVGDQYWILTHWKKRPTEAIKVSSLQRMLEYYGPRQVAIIGDACQEFSAKFIDVVGSPVLDMPDEEQAPYELDQFFAVDAGKQAFMIKGVDGQDDFCLFTEVLLDALEGDAAQASYEQIGQDRVVTSQSLALYLDGHVAQEAGKYGVRMVPRPKPGFYTDRIYLKMPPAAGQPPAPVPTQGGAAPQAAQGRRRAARPPPLPCSRAGNITATGDRPCTAGAACTSGTIRRCARFQTSRAAFASRQRQHARRPATAVGAKPAHGGEGAAQAAGAAGRAGRAGTGHPPDARGQARRICRTGWTRHRARSFETGCGICVSVPRWSSPASGRGFPRGGEPNWFRIHPATERLAALERHRGHVASGRLCSAAWSGIMPRACAGRDISLFHRRIGQRVRRPNRHRLMARANAGLLSQDEISYDCPCARAAPVITWAASRAVYDTIRDIDSLRSMASLYAQRGQPVPLDIVLYGGGRVFESGGRLYADIPATPVRTPRTREEQRQGFCFDGTPGFDRHPIAGRVPWMRHAWGAVATASCDASAEPWRRKALAAMAHLAPGAFTGFQPGGRQALEELVGLETSVLASQYVVATQDNAKNFRA